jgi:hypothetical protein
MAELVAWSAIGLQQENESNGIIRRLKLTSDEACIVRFVGNPVGFHKYILNGRGAICGNPDTCPVRAKYGIEPHLRYAVNVIDRDEASSEHRLNILDVLPSVLKPVAVWSRRSNADPGSMAGCDFSIEMIGRGTQTHYRVTALDRTPFTTEEKEYLRRNLYDLSRIYSAAPENEIESRLFPEAGRGSY